MKTRIVVTGLIGSIPLAGLDLHYLQYAAGLRDLGHDVLYLEDTGAWYYDPRTDGMIDDPRSALAHLKARMDAFGLGDRWTFVDLEGAAHGVAGARLDDFLRTAETFVNVTGAGLVRGGVERIPVRAYVDTDPGYVQARAASGSETDLAHLRSHTAHFTFGTNVGRAGCGIPTLGLEWRPTVQPLVPGIWPKAPPPPPGAPWTTVLKWRTYDPVEHAGTTLGPKEPEFLRFLDLPSRVGPPLEIAATGPPPRGDLEDFGWRVRPGRDVSGSIAAYRDYIHASRGEWSVAKGGYVALATGWFGDRSAAYLASGRPVVLQSTGWEARLPTGHGLLSFRDLEGAAAGIEAVEADWEAHARAAREIAEAHFAAPRVLTELLDRATAS